MNKEKILNDTLNKIGKVRAVCVSEKKGVQKKPVPYADFKENYGITTDAHAGNWHRQVSLLSYDKVEEFNKKGANVSDGEFGENIVVEGLDFRSMPVGTVFKCKEVILKMTQIGKECHTHCAIYQKMGECIMPTQGVFAEVIKGGRIEVGEKMIAEFPDGTQNFTAAVLVLSDKGSTGQRVDESGPTAEKILKDKGFDVVERLVISDDKDLIKKELIRLADMRQVNLILTSGGTGMAPRDNTPEATIEVADKLVPGIAEAIRNESMKYTKRAMLSRGVAVIRQNSLIVNLPGSPKAVKESLDAILDTLDHGLKLIRGTDSECARH